MQYTLAWRGMAVLCVLATLGGCVGAMRATPGFRADDGGIQATRASAWEEMTAAALKSDGAELISTVPSDIGAYCPGYARATADERRTFWGGVLATVWHVRQGQPSPTAAGCQAGEDEQAAMACTVRLVTARVAGDGAIFGDSSRGWLGLARNWLPFRRSSLRAEVAAWGASRSFCR